MTPAITHTTSPPDGSSARPWTATVMPTGLLIIHYDRGGGGYWFVDPAGDYRFDLGQPLDSPWNLYVVSFALKESRVPLELLAEAFHCAQTECWRAAA